MLGGKIISIRDGQMVFDDNGYKCTVKNYSRKVRDFSTFRVYSWKIETKSFTKFMPPDSKGKYTISIIKVEKAFAKMIHAKGVKLMLTDNIDTFHQQRIEAHKALASQPEEVIVIDWNILLLSNLKTAAYY